MCIRDRINGMYGAEIAKQGFSGYVCEVLVYYLGSFENVLKKISKLKNNEIDFVGQVVSGNVAGILIREKI